MAERFTRPGAEAAGARNGGLGNDRGHGSAVAVRGADAALGPILAHAVADAAVARHADGRPPVDPAARRRMAKRREKHCASAEFDRTLGDLGDLPGRVYFPGEYYPTAAARMLDAIDAELVALERIRNFAAGIAWAIDRGDSLTEVLDRIERGAAVVLGRALLPVDGRGRA
ncbi:hypothetical protein [Nocardia otitidiscaviarum]|uniref:hypothetical protein n=1 Tax=Nocardia otitidiscaviarum TaxID=1823 RepID=UPI002455B001|nr:hypothetical protein [Nocardia otitidiscaviarum]